MQSLYATKLVLALSSVAEEFSWAETKLLQTTKVITITKVVEADRNGGLVTAVRSGIMILDMQFFKYLIVDFIVSTYKEDLVMARRA